MGLDVGDARVGIAISDPLGISAQCYPALERDKSFYKKLKSLIEEKDVSTLVIGLPYELSGDLGEQAKKVENFVNNLSQKLIGLDLSVVFIDERLTTSEAKRVLSGSKLKNREKSAALDSISASLILETHLNSLK